MATDSPKNITVLIVEDNALSLLLLQEQLTQLGALVVPARGGARVAALLEGVTPDLVITDINMPGVSGYDVLSLIKAIDRQIPVYAISASLCDGDFRERGAWEFTDYLLKPITLSQLAGLLDRVVEQQACGHPRHSLTSNFPQLEQRHLPVFKAQMDEDLNVLAELRVDKRLAPLRDWLHGVSGGLACSGASGLLDLCHEVQAEVQEATVWNSRIDELLAAFRAELLIAMRRA